MKKWTKYLSLALVVVTLMLCLCGCDALDRRRENQGFWNADGNITWNGTLYKKLPYDDHLYVEPDYSRTLYITQPDVPVLLSIFESSYYCTEDQVFIEGEGGTYCREDRYQEIWDRIYSPFQPDLVCYRYNVYNEEKQESETRYYTLTKEQTDMISLVLENEVPQELGNGLYLDADLRLDLWECSKDMLFRRNSMEIAQSGKVYYLYLYTEEKTLLFTVPSGCNDTCEDILEAYKKRNEQSFEEVI